MPSWTAASEVRVLLKGAGTPMSDAEITHLLNDAEGYWFANFKLTSTAFTFSASKPSHLMLRELICMRAAMKVIAATPQSWRTLEEAQTALDVYRDLYIDGVGIANNMSVADFILEEA